MTTRHQEAPTMEEICRNVKRLGYTARECIRLYGEDFEVVSDPFPDADGISVNVKTKKSAEVRVLRLPATVLQSVCGQSVRAR